MADRTDPQVNGYAGDVTPSRAWEMLGEDPRAVLVDVRTGAEWQFVGVPDLSPLGRRTRFVEWIDFPSGAPNPRFGEQLRAEVEAERGADAVADTDATGTDAPEASAPILFLCRSGQRSIGAAIAATGAGLGPAFNILEGFEGGLDGHGHRGGAGWRAAGLPWCQS
ncbi:rhodanese-like domain-containing protein [Tomitella fengzijianii]|uniref:Rhodanese-like domain-containing protein n=1 Tax=Tomitella fengzijianii TaxID=2597660 RepID=A0A516X5Q9_9ACTN|nr:rhodanese-like domain-containing protein [Tomitella fengzijianii]QDQ98399.1 rhodanese-like domain-containing protein [Tomitella fengzijianii]